LQGRELLQWGGDILSNPDIWWIVQAPIGISVEPRHQQRAIAYYALTPEEGSENILAARAHPGRAVDDGGQLPQGVVLGIASNSARRFGEEIHGIHGGFVVEVSVSVRASGQKYFEERGWSCLCLARETPEEQGTPADLDAFLQACVMVGVLVGLKTSTGVSIPPEAEGVAGIVRRGRCGAVPYL
jgi:hypothetical protein